MQKNKFILILFLFVFSNLPLKSQWIEIGKNTLQTDYLHIDQNNVLYLAAKLWNKQNKHNVAIKLGNYWSILGGNSFGLDANGAIKNICTDKDNNVYAAGQFTNKSSKFYVAKYNGEFWSELGGHNALSANGWINSICEDNKGNLYAAGNFTKSNGKYFVAKWDGQKWDEIGGLDTFSFNGPINSLCCDSLGNVFAAGYFENGPLSKGKKFVAVWDGKTWKELGGKDALGSLGYMDNILNICLDKNNNLYASGKFNYVAKWDGKNWLKLSNFTFNNYVLSMNCDGNGNLLVGGDFKNSTGKHYVARWDGSTWSELKDADNASDLGSIYCIKSNSNNELVIAATNIGISKSAYMAKWVGSWIPYGGQNKHFSVGADNIVFSSYGEIYEAPYADTVVSFWNGLTWVKINSSKNYKNNSQGFAFDKFGRYYRSVLHLNDVGSHIERFNGISWDVVGNDTNMFKGRLSGHDIIRGLIVEDFSNFYAIGNWIDKWSNNWIYRWDGTSLTKLGNANFNGYIQKICKDLNGNIYIAGYFKNTSGNYYIAKWNGSNFIELGPSNAFANLKEWGNIKVDHLGNLFATGVRKDGKSLIVKWDGQNWNDVGDIISSLNFKGMIFDLVLDKKGNLIVSGAIDSNAYTKPTIAKWDGQKWSELPGISNLGSWNLSFGINLGIDKFDNIYAKIQSKKGWDFVFAKWDNCKSLINQHPKDLTINLNSNGLFNVKSSHENAKYQWLISNETGFEEIVNSAIFSGVQNDSLFLKNIDNSNNYKIFRCKVTSDLCSEVSDPAILKVESNLSVEPNFVSFKVYPIPTPNSLNVSINSILIGQKYLITDVSGIVVMTGVLNSIDNLIDLSRLKSGVYFLNLGLQNHNSIKVIKF